MGKSIIIFFLIIFGILPTAAGNRYLMVHDISPVTVTQKDTIYMKVLPQLDVYPRPVFKNNRQRRLYYRLIRDVRITLPYAKQAAHILDRVNDSLNSIHGEKAKKEYLKSVEKDLFSQFEQPLRHLTFSQGRLLIKLVDRECQQNSYALVKLYRGGFSAFFWQGIARIFGANLKAEYDAKGEDFQTEQIVRLVERGLL
jgi:hypothetical protein